ESFMSISAAHDVDEGEDDDPDRVDEVPVEADDLELLEVLAADALGEREDRHHGHEDEADGHVARVQADERVEGGAEEVGGDGEALVDDEVPPLDSGAAEEDGAEDESRDPPAGEAAPAAAPQSAQRELHRRAAREEADAEEDRRTQDLGRRTA